MSKRHILRWGIDTLAGFVAFMGACEATGSFWWGSFGGIVTLLYGLWCFYDGTEGRPA